MKPSIKTAVDRTIISTRDEATKVARLKHMIHQDIEAVNAEEVSTDAPFCHHIAITHEPTPAEPNEPLVIEHSDSDYFKTIISYCGEIGLACDRLVNYVRCNLQHPSSSGGDIT